MERPRGNVAVGTKVHLVVAVLFGVGKSLCPKRLDSLDRPLVIVEHCVDGVEVDQRRRVDPRAPHDEDRPLVDRAVELRARKVGRVGDDHCRRLVGFPQRVVDALEARAEVSVALDERNRHSKGRLFEDDRWRRRKHEVQVVLGAVRENLPHPLGALLGQVLVLQPVIHDRRHREHHVVDRRGTQVLGCAHALFVLGAGEPRHRHALGALLAVGGTEDAHAALATLAVRQGVARLAAMNVVHPARAHFRRTSPNPGPKQVQPGPLTRCQNKGVLCGAWFRVHAIGTYLSFAFY